MATDTDPLLGCIDKALAIVRSQDGNYEQAARDCLEDLRSEAQKHRDDYLKLSMHMLVEALRSPETERRRDVLDALLACRRTVLQGKP